MKSSHRILFFVILSILLFQDGVEARIESYQNFLFSDFGSINKHSMETHTLPSRIALTALVLDGREQGWIAKDSINYIAVLSKFGFYTPTAVKNAPPQFRPRFGHLPMGLTEKEIRFGLPGVHLVGLNVTCASCHAGRLYDKNGVPTNDVWLGLPNTSINLEGYTQAVYRGLKLVSRDTSGTQKLLRQIFPETSVTERLTTQFFGYSQVKKRMQKLESLYDQALPFSNGGPGVTNGVAALKYTLGFMDRDSIQPEFAFTSIPPLGDRRLRSSLLYDGVYASPNVERFSPISIDDPIDPQANNAIIAIFTIPTMGQSKKGALANTPEVDKVVDDLIPGYVAPVFPGEINYERAQRGFAIFKQECAACHGDYEWKGKKPFLRSFPNKLVSQEEMGTDSHRWEAITSEFVEAFNKTVLASVALAKRSEGYVATPLNSLWATAPYLHNASVPTLWDLMHPEDRPTRFLVGGHWLDFRKMGLRLVENTRTHVFEYPAEVKPWSMPVVYDTTTPGRGNQGHIAPFDRLSEEEKENLTEYLKLL